MKHWILTRATLQTLTTNLDRNLMKLSAAKNYMSAYGAPIPGRTKAEFLKNLANAVNQSESMEGSLL